MPRIRGENIEAHHEMVWADLAEAVRQLLAERDYDDINMGHIAARAGLARNTLYNYAPDKSALVLALTNRAARPAVERVTAIAAATGETATERLREIIATVLEATKDQALQLMFRPGQGALPKGPGGPLHEIVVEVENVVRAGIANHEFRPVDDIQLTVELLSGVMRSGGERIGRDPSTSIEIIESAQAVILAALASANPPVARDPAARPAMPT
jgi:AcrR family transcriptional regulator